MARRSIGGWNEWAEALVYQSAHYSYAALSRHIAAFQNELVYGGHLTALGAPVKVLTVSILLNVPVNIPLLFIAYLAPLIVYSVDYYQSLDKDMATNRERTMYLAGKAGIFPYVIAFYVALLLVSLALFANSRLDPSDSGARAMRRYVLDGF